MLKDLVARCRSYRRFYEDEKIPAEALRELVDLARMTASTANSQALKFLREREVVHFQRFGEALEKIKSNLDSKNFYYFNPEFDKQFVKK